MANTAHLNTKHNFFHPDGVAPEHIKMMKGITPGEPQHLVEKQGRIAPDDIIRQHEIAPQPMQRGR